MLIIFFSLITLHSYASIDAQSSYTQLHERAISQKRFNEIIHFMELGFQPFASKNQRQLEFLTDYQDDWAQAFARRWENDQVVVYGGISRFKHANEESFVLALCHELGHLYGGEPVQEPHNKMAVEGQADFWATSVCWPQAVNYLPSKVPSARSLNVCKQNVVCARGLDAALNFSAFFAENRNIPAPEIETPDTKITDRLIFDHPSPQCRLDTYLSGLKGGSRPLCWFHTL